MGDTSKKTRLVVIGAGLAGLSAAVRGAELGLAVQVLECSAEDDYVCASRMTGGLFHIAMDDMAAPPETVRANLDRMTEGTADPRLAEAISRRARPTLDWLRSQGVRFIGVGPEGFRKNSLSPPGIRQTGRHRDDGAPYWAGRCGDTLLRTLGTALARHGGSLLRGTCATQLLMDGERCVGVRAQRDGAQVAFAADAVVVADGGFQSNEELLKRFIAAHPERVLQRNGRSGHGFGLQMAQEVGARLVGTEAFYGHLVHRDALEDDRLWPYPVVDLLATSGILVDGSGRRFCDEGWGGVHAANELARQPDPTTAWSIFDQAIWEGPAKDWLLPPNPYLPAAGGRIVDAPGVEELARKIDIDPQVLSQTVGSYNAFVRDGVPVAPPRRSMLQCRAWPIEAGSFYAVPTAAGITYTMGGIATDGQARVLRDSDAAPIGGLYAAGSCTGGLEGGGHSGYSGGLSKASVFGVLAAEHAATLRG